MASSRRVKVQERLQELLLRAKAHDERLNASEALNRAAQEANPCAYRSLCANNDADLHIEATADELRGGLADDALPSSKRVRKMSDLELAVEAIKNTPTTDQDCEKLYSTVEELVASICALAASLTDAERAKVGELASGPPHDAAGWIGYAVGCTALENLKRIDSVMAEPASYNSGDCVICLDPLGSETTTTTPCMHSMHEACLKQWLQVAPKPRCPLCVGPLARPAGASVSDEEQGVAEHRVLYASAYEEDPEAPPRFNPLHDLGSEAPPRFNSAHAFAVLSPSANEEDWEGGPGFQSLPADDSEPPMFRSLPASGDEPPTYESLGAPDDCNPSAFQSSGASD